MSLIPEKVPFFYVARCPIERLQHAVNHTNGGGTRKNISPLMKKFNLSCDYTKLFPKIVYGVVVPHIQVLSSSKIQEKYYLIAF